MKAIIKLAGSLFLLSSIYTNSVNAQLLGRLKETVKSHVEDHVDQRTGEATDKAMDNAENGAKKNNSDNSGTEKNADSKVAGSSTPAKPALKVYSNYDFIPGDKILFEDNFADDQDGEFPAHWELQKGQGLINMIDGAPAFCLTEGNYATVNPRLKTTSYLTDPFTVEFDYYIKDGGAFGLNVFLEAPESKEGIVAYGANGNVSTGYFSRDFSADYPDKNAPSEDFYNKWHHGALIYKNNQMKCYVDQYRVLVVPNVDFNPISVEFGGIGSAEEPIIFKNVRIASGGEMNMIGKKFTESKIVTHGINFDVD